MVLSGLPDFGAGPAREKLEIFRRDHDRFRSAIVNEPRGSDVLVGAALVPTQDRTCHTGVIFFNNVGYLGMCGHGTIGVVETLRHLGRIHPGEVRLETPVGVVTAQLHSDGSVSVHNVASYRRHKAASVTVPGLGTVVGDVAWGGNWFFLVESTRWALGLENVEQLIEVTWRIRQAVNQQGFPEVDHIELFGPPARADADARNFVLCPGKAYDRSPCGTGTSAKLACLVEDGKLSPGQVWRQESITGSLFEGTVSSLEPPLRPAIRGRAHVNAEVKLLLHPDDPCCWGITPR